MTKKEAVPECRRRSKDGEFNRKIVERVPEDVTYDTVHLSCGHSQLELPSESRMREICTSGLMSGDGKRGGASASVLAPILDSTKNDLRCYFYRLLAACDPRLGQHDGEIRHSANLGPR